MSEKFGTLDHRKFWVQKMWRRIIAQRRWVSIFFRGGMLPSRQCWIWWIRLGTQSGNNLIKHFTIVILNDWYSNNFAHWKKSLLTGKCLFIFLNQTYQTNASLLKALEQACPRAKCSQHNLLTKPLLVCLIEKPLKWVKICQFLPL